LLHLSLLKITHVISCRTLGGSNHLHPSLFNMLSLSWGSWQLFSTPLLLSKPHTFAQLSAELQSSAKITAVSDSPTVSPDSPTGSSPPQKKMKSREVSPLTLKAEDQEHCSRQDQHSNQELTPLLECDLAEPLKHHITEPLLYQRHNRKNKCQ
jgi:hypothetical protein